MGTRRAPARISRVIPRIIVRVQGSEQKLKGTGYIVLSNALRVVYGIRGLLSFEKLFENIKVKYIYI